MIALRSTALACSLLVAPACGAGDGDRPGPSETEPAGRSDDPPHARRDLLEVARADLAAPRHASDGGGRAWIEAEDGAPPARAGEAVRLTVLYEAGPRGVAVGGAVTFVVPPFWGWSPPQAVSPDAPGYTAARTEAEGVELDVSGDPQRRGVRAVVRGRPLREGERVRFTYGAGRARARADRFAERESALWVRVDGDGDGVDALVVPPATLDVAPGPPARIVAHLPSAARPGEEIELRAALFDAAGNRAGPGVSGVVEVSVPEGIEAHEESAPAEGDVAEIRLVAREPGVHRVAVRWRLAGEDEDAGALGAESNPIHVAESSTRILWGDLHGHSGLSDGTGTPEDYFRFAREVAALDVAALTDHDHYGVRPLAHAPDLWERIQAAVREAHEPGRFVALLGYEWTSWIHGHRHVLWFDGEERDVRSSVDPRYETPAQLWDALRGEPALTFAHHSAGGPIPTNWDYAPDPELEPVTEIASVHGASEAADAPHLIYDPRGEFVREVLEERGYRLGFVGSGDSHDGHPGLAHLAMSSGGLAAILAEEATREAVRDALRERRVYATNGPRIVLRTALDGRRMGSALPAPPEDEELFLWVQAAGTAPIARIDVLRKGLAETVRGDGSSFFEGAVALDGLRPGDFVYIRVVQEDGGAAWSSPFYLD